MRKVQVIGFILNLYHVKTKGHTSFDFVEATLVSINFHKRAAGHTRLKTFATSNESTEKSKYTEL